MKKIIFAIIVMLSCILSLGCSKTEGALLYNSGVYEGEGKGHEGPIKVQVTLEDNKIKNIEIVEEYEMPEISEHVYDEVIDNIIRKEGTDIDYITGATYTSKGLIEAIDAALQKAKIEE